MRSQRIEPAEVAKRVLEKLQASANPENVAGMARFGISSVGTLGVSTPTIWSLAKQAVGDLGARDLEARHEAARLLWASGIHEARIATAKIDAAELVGADQMLAWSLEIDSWDVCDQLCMHCWWQAPQAHDVSLAFSRRAQPYVKRVAFALMARFAMKLRDADGASFAPYLEACVREACDGRNEVKKAVSWAVRQIGKRDVECRREAMAAARRMLDEHGDCPSARWIARDALRELESDAVRRRLGLAEG